MPLKVPSFSGLAGALFDYISGTDQTQGVVGLTKVVFGPDGSAFTRVDAGSGLPVDTVTKGSATDRGAIIGFTGAQFTTTNGSTTVTLTTAPTSGLPQDGNVVVGAGIPAGATLTLASGTRGAVGSTYTLSAAATATATGVAGTSVGPQQIMAANTSRRGVSYQVQSTTANVWTNGTAGTATADYHSLKIAAAAYYESPPTHVGTGAIWAISDTPATPLYAREF